MTLLLKLEGFLFLAAILQLVLGAIIFNMFKAHIGSISFTFASTLSSSLLAFSHFSRELWFPGFNFFLLILKDFNFFLIEPLVQLETQFFTFQDLVNGFFLEKESSFQLYA